MTTAGCTPISSRKVLGGWLLPNLTSDRHPGFGPPRGGSVSALATHYLLTRVVT